MKPFLEALAEGPLLFDGAIGSYLYDRGVFLNRSYDELSLSQPALIRQVHREYAQAGAQVLECNTFAANRLALTKHGHSDKTEDINRAAVALCREVAGEDAYVAGAMGPTGVPFAIASASDRSLAEDALREQADLLAESGADLLCIETYYSILEIEAAITAAKRTGLPVVAHIVFDANRRADGCLSPVDVARRMVDVGADVVGANCGAGPAELYDVGVQMLEIGVPVSIQPNAGFPSVVDGRSIYVANPEHFGVFARRMLKAGIRLIGGCCGTTPDHIRSMLGALRMMSCDSTLPGSSPATADITAGADAVPARPEPIVPLAERSRLGQRIATGAFAVSVELTSPPGTDPSAMLQRIDKLVAAGVDVVNVADGPRATARMGNLSTCSVAAATTGVEPILHVCCRDRNYLGLISHLLGAHALGLRNLVIITGDPPKMGDYPFATPVYDVDSIGLLKMAATLNSGRDPAGKELRGHTSFVLATGAEPAARDYEREMRRLEDKIAAGAELVMTQPVYDPATLDRFLNDVQPMNIPIMVGLLPLASHRNAEFLHNEVPGMQIPQEYRDRMAAVGSGPAARAEGVRIAQEALIAVKHRVAGAYIMPPFNRVESAISILEVVKDRWTPAQKPEPSPLVADRAPAPAKAAAS